MGITIFTDCMPRSNGAFVCIDKDAKELCLLRKEKITVDDLTEEEKTAFLKKMLEKDNT